MQVHDWISAVLVGIVIGVLGRLVLPGRQRIGAFVTFLIGVGSALLGTFVADWLKVNDKAPVEFIGIHWDWVVFGIQVGFAVLGTALAAAISHTRVAQNDPPKKAPARKATKARKS